MRWYTQWACILGMACLVGGCSGGDKAEQAAVAEKPAPAVAIPAGTEVLPSPRDTVVVDATPSPEPIAASAPESTPQSEPEIAPPQQPGPKVVPQPEPESPATPDPAPEVQAEAIPGTVPVVADEFAGQVVAVPPTRSGLTAIGAVKCKTCHKVQYESWITSAHAERTPPLDCEGCHGLGSEYKKLAVMKDPTLAGAAGLVLPAKSFCTTTCHRNNWQDDMLARSHAHKVKAP
jgi:hypothetical protein